MAKKLIRLYEQDTTDFSNNGLKILSPTSAKITRNLIEYTYQLELTHLLDEKGMMLTEERILGYNGQYFRISSIRRNLKEVSIIAKHIFFDLNKNFIEDISIKNKTGSMALSHILGGTSYPHSFSATSDIDTVASSRLVRKNVVSALIGDTDNSFINRWGGELDIDGFTFKLNEQIGKDDGYTIQYGKNLTGLDLQLNMLEVVTRIRPVGFDGIEIDGLYVDSPYIDNYALPIIKEIKYENVKWKGSPNYEEREDDDSYIYDNLAEAQAKLIELATNEFVVNEIDLPKTTINIEFIELSKTEEYKHLKFLQNINIGDTVHIYHKPLNINLKSRCIEYVYDCILNKYETITLGSYTKNFFSQTQITNNKVDNGNLDIEFSGMINDILQKTEQHLTDTITQAMGGYVYKTNNALYIMDTDDISTAQKIWVWNKNGLAYSSTGIDGPYTTGITMDGHIVGSMISANSITGEQIQANSIKTANLELSVQKKIQDATNEETVKALIKADLDGFESTLSKEFVTVENATTQIQQATEVAVKEATQSIIDNAVSESMGAVDGQLNDKLNQYTSGTLLPAINEKAEEVLQNAEDYVVTQLESYATKQELSSSISQTREQIELSVSEKYTTKTESATIITEAIDGITVGAINRALGTGENKSFKFNGGANETWLPYKFSNDISDKEAYVSFNYTLTGTAQNGSQIEFAPSYLKKANNQTVYRPKHIFFTSNRLQDVNITDTVSFTTKDFQDISPSSTSYIRFVGNGFTGTLSISEVQIKPGNSKTSWSPAPEDVNNDIVNAKNEAIISANNTLISTIANHYTKSETDSKISVAKDEINLGVSNKYETKANVETKVSSTLSSAKSYADTKKTEAINSAASDAASKVNAAKSELNTAIGKKANTVDVYSKAEVYTKAQTDSAIKVAKDEINLGVSNTYETKANVATKASNAVTEARRITDTRSTNQNPQWYMTNYPRQTINEFKHANAIGIPNSTTNYGTLTTNVPWNDNSGGYPVQTFRSSDYKTYERKGTSNTAWSAWVQVENAVDSQAKANAAKQEAINSANSTLNTTIANYYTKTQTDSQINVAKNAITQSVASTYETKTEVTNKINAIQIGGRNLLRNSQNYSNWLGENGTTVSTIDNSNEPTKILQVTTNGGASGHVKINVSNYIKGKEYILSFYAKNISGDKTIKFEPHGGPVYSVTSTSEWVQYKVKIIPNQNWSSTVPYFYFNNKNNTSVFQIKNVKLEEGNKATSWTPAPEDMETTVSNLTQRVSTAESKITDTAITNVVKQNFYTKSETDNQITSKGYQTASQVQQTVDNLQIKFTETGGYNLIRNSSGLNGTSSWTKTGSATLGTATNTNIGGACDKYMYLDNGTTTSEQFAFSSRFKLKPSTKYTLTGWFHNYTKCPHFDVFVLSSTSVDSSDTGTSYTHVHHLIQAQNTNGAWKKYSVSFTTPSGCKSGVVRIDNNGYNANGSNSNRIHWSALILSEGALEVPWSPHPNEVYDGLTSIDKEGITVTASNVHSKTKMSADGFQLIRTTDDKKMFYVNQDGSLEMSGNFTQYDSNGKISVKIANNSYNCYDWLWDGDYVGKLGAFESNRTNTSGANQRFIGIANIADYGNQLILGVRSSPNSTNFNSYIEIDNTSLMHRDYVTFTANTGFKTNAIFRNPSNNNETGRIFGATNEHFFVTCNHNNQLRLGYEKNGSYYPGMSIYRNDNTSAGCAIEYYADEVHHNNVVIDGFLSVKGQKNRLVATENFGDRLLNAYETAECYFGDINEAIIGEDGEVKVELDEIFLETVNTTEPYQVFLTKYGEGDCYVSERHEKYFVIKGTPNLSVGFEVKAKQRGYEKERLKMAVDTSKSHQATPSEDEAGYTIDCETTINRA